MQQKREGNKLEMRPGSGLQDESAAAEEERERERARA